MYKCVFKISHCKNIRCNHHECKWLSADCVLCFFAVKGFYNTFRYPFAKKRLDIKSNYNYNLTSEMNFFLAHRFRYNRHREVMESGNWRERGEHRAEAGDSRQGGLVDLI